MKTWKGLGITQRLLARGTRLNRKLNEDVEEEKKEKKDEGKTEKTKKNISDCNHSKTFYLVVVCPRTHEL